ncbi:MAG: hypothetical protein JXA20_03595 [Spirochaetes bacterium]|nr:hypothetical protein [Spirochaetota bacterium]
MKRYLTTLALLLCTVTLGCGGMFGDWQDISSSERDVIWQSVDGPAGTMNVNTGVNAGCPRLLSADGRLYAAWIESGAVIVKLYGGDDSAPLWITIPSPGAASVDSLDLGWLNGQLHAIVSDASSYVLVFRLSADAAYWEQLSAGTIHSGTSPMTNLILVPYSGALYALWQESTLIRMRRHEGGTTWSAFGTAGVEDSFGVDDVGGTDQIPSATVYNGSLVAAYRHGLDFLKVRAYSSLTGSWSTWAENIRRGSTASDHAQGSSLHATSGRLYLAWQEYNDSIPNESIWVKDITPGYAVWTDTDMTNIYGIRYHRNYTTGSAFPPFLNSVNGRLFAMWREMENSGGGYPLNIATVRCRLFSGDIITPSWLYIDGGGYFGIRNNDMYTIPGMYSVTHDSKIYVMFMQSTALFAANQAHVTVGY